MAYRAAKNSVWRRFAGGPAVWMQRIGYASRGVVFLVVGGFALLAAGGFSTHPQGARDALELVFQGPFGYFLWLVTFGLLCFAGWHFRQAVVDGEGHGTSLYGLLRRGVLAASGLFYVALAAAIARLSFMPRPVSEDQSAREWTAWALAQPFGRGVIALVAVGFLAIALGLMVKAYRAPGRDRLDVPSRFRVWAVAAGAFGILTRAVMFLMIGGFLGLAAYNSNSREAAGLAGVLRAVHQQTYGAVFLAIAAFGLLAFGFFEILEAAARRPQTRNRAS
jgi:hypothetical protein